MPKMYELSDGFVMGSNKGGMIRTSLSLDTIWTKYYDLGGGSDFPVHPTSFIRTSDNCYILTSYGVGPRGYRASQIIMIDIDGQVMWDKTNKPVEIENIIQNKDGDFIYTGRPMLGKTNNIGDIIWSKDYSIYGTGECVLQSFDGGYVVLINSKIWAEDKNIMLLKTNESGDFLWSKTFGGSGDDIGKCMIQDSDGGYVILGSTEPYGAGESDMWLIKVDSLGDKIWTKTIGGDSVDYGNYIQQTSDGGYIVVGTTYSYGAGGSDIWVIRLEKDPYISHMEKENNSVPSSCSLDQNYPNPFNPTTVISWQLAVSSNVELSVYNLLGEKIETLINKPMPAGYHEVEFNGQNLSSGIYLYKIVVDSYGEAGAWQDVKKMTLLR
jgi:hypothetical protein